MQLLVLHDARGGGGVQVTCSLLRPDAHAGIGGLQRSARDGEPRSVNATRRGRVT